MHMVMTNNETKTNLPDKNMRLLACGVVGREWWKDYCESENGKDVMEKLPSDRVRERAEDIFLLGFCSRMLVSPPGGRAEPDRMAEEKDLTRLWVDYLEISGGEIVLDGSPFPRTEETTLLVAKSFFRLGYRAGTVVWRQLREPLIPNTGLATATVMS